MVLLSSQYPNDLAPESLKQLDYCILFQGHSLDKLKLLHSLLDLSDELQDFIEKYKVATEKRFNFLYIDVVLNKYRKNFNLEFR